MCKQPAPIFKIAVKQMKHILVLRAFHDNVKARNTLQTVSSEKQKVSLIVVILETIKNRYFIIANRLKQLNPTICRIKECQRELLFHSRYSCLRFTLDYSGHIIPPTPPRALF